jgi:hypothetical protein
MVNQWLLLAGARLGRLELSDLAAAGQVISGEKALKVVYGLIFLASCRVRISSAVREDNLTRCESQF